MLRRPDGLEGVPPEVASHSIAASHGKASLSAWHQPTVLMVLLQCIDHHWALRQTLMKRGFPEHDVWRCRYKICEFHLKVHSLILSLHNDKCIAFEMEATGCFRSVRLKVCNTLGAIV